MIKDLKDSANKLYQKQEEENIWKGSYFEDFNKLCVDYSGQAGEDGFNDFLIRTKGRLHNWEIDYSGCANINQADGTYDITITGKNKKKWGVKTARKGKSQSFQHENLHESECDGEVFIDISPNCVYLTIIDYNSYSLKDKHPIFNLKPHLRKNTTNNYKFDLREAHLEKGVTNNTSIRLDETTNNPDELVIDFLSKFIDK